MRAMLETRRVVLVTRTTEYERLLARHATRDQARFFLRTRGQTIDEIEERHHALGAARRQVLAAIPLDWRRGAVRRGDLDRFLFEPHDIIVALGQDGLVANVAKYLEGQPVIGLNPDPGRNAGVLVPHAPKAAARLLAAVAAGRAETEDRTMVEAVLDDGQTLLALNEVFVGHRTHQSARYVLETPGGSEFQSSSGLIVATGTGATGWARSIHRQRRSPLRLPDPDEERLLYFVREAWPSVSTGATLTEGAVTEDGGLEIVSRMEDDGVVFGDGIEADRIDFSWGRRVTVRVAERRLRLVQP